MDNQENLRLIKWKIEFWEPPKGISQDDVDEINSYLSKAIVAKKNLIKELTLISFALPNGERYVHIEHFIRPIFGVNNLRKLGDCFEQEVIVLKKNWSFLYESLINKSQSNKKWLPMPENIPLIFTIEIIYE